jgi:hypothetical protein
MIIISPVLDASTFMCVDSAGRLSRDGKMSGLAGGPVKAHRGRSSFWNWAANWIFMKGHKSAGNPEPAQQSYLLLLMRSRACST